MRIQMRATPYHADYGDYHYAGRQHDPHPEEIHH
jgi:hypothetical protein